MGQVGQFLGVLPMRAFALLVALLCYTLPLAAQGRVRVRPHITRHGVHVPRHQRTAPNHTRLDNWSTRGRVNPLTGRKGSTPVIEAPKVRRPRGITR